MSGTPAFFIRGKRYNGPMMAVKPILDAELKPKK